MTALITPEELKAIQSGETLFIEKITVHGTYQNGLPYVREHQVGMHLHQQDHVRINHYLHYPDPLLEPMEGTVQ